MAFKGSPFFKDDNKIEVSHSPLPPSLSFLLTRLSASLKVNPDGSETAWCQGWLAGRVDGGDGSLGKSQWIAISLPIWAGGGGRRRLGEGTTCASRALANHQALSSP